MKLHPPGTITVGEARDDAELKMADIRQAIEGNLAAHEIPADVMDAVLHHVDLAVDKALRRFEERIAQKLGEH